MLKSGAPPQKNKPAKENNKKVDISGILAYGDDYFLQCLEGVRTAVNNLYHKILTDPRHKNVILLGYTEVSERQFPQWSMNHVLITEDKRQLVMKYSTSSEFNPFRMSGKSANGFLVSLL